MQESSEKEEVVLEKFSDDDLAPYLEIEESTKEVDFVLGPMDVHIFTYDNMATSNTYFQEQNYLSSDIIE